MAAPSLPDRQKVGRGGTLDAQRERATTTRRALLDAARTMFGEDGYHASPTPELVARAAVTRGALYHHFAGKEDLFAEVFRSAAAEMVGRSNASVVGAGDLWSKIVAAFDHYLQLAASNPGYARIVLIDGPAVLGWARWRELQSEIVAAGVADALAMLMDEGTIVWQPVGPLAYLIQAALNDAALAIANSNEPDRTSRDVSHAFRTLLTGLRTKPS